MNDAKVGLITIVLSAVILVGFAYKASINFALIEQENQQLLQENRELEIKFDSYQDGVKDSK